MNKNLFEYCCATEFRNVISNDCFVYRSVLHAHMIPQSYFSCLWQLNYFLIFQKKSTIIPCYMFSFCSILNLIWLQKLLTWLISTGGLYHGDSCSSCKEAGDYLINLVFDNRLSCSVYICMTKWVVVGMEIPKVVGGILEVFAIDKTSIIWCFASGIIICQALIIIFNCLVFPYSYALVSIIWCSQ